MNLSSSIVIFFAFVGLVGPLSAADGDNKSGFTQTAERVVDGAATVTVGIGASQWAGGRAEQASDDRWSNMIENLKESFRCQVTGMPTVDGGESGMMPAYSEKFRDLRLQYLGNDVEEGLAGKLKRHKEALGLRPGLESEVLIGTDALYSNEARMQNEFTGGFSTAQDRAESGEAQQRMQSGGRLAVVGAAGAFGANTALQNQDAIKGAVGKVGSAIGGLLTGCGRPGLFAGQEGGMAAGGGTTSDPTVMSRRAAETKSRGEATQIRITAAGSAYDLFKKDFDEAERTATDAGKAADKRVDDLTKVKGTIQKAEEALAKAMEDFENAEQKLREEQEKEGVKDADIKKKEDEASKHKNTVETAQKALDYARGQLTTERQRQTEARAVVERVAGLKITIATSKKTFEQRKNDVADANKTTDAIVGEMEKVPGAIKTAQNKLDMANDALKTERSKESPTNLPATEAAVKKEQDALKKVIDDANDKLRAAEAKAAEAENAAAGAETAINSAKAASEAARAEVMPKPVVVVAPENQVQVPHPAE